MIHFSSYQVKVLGPYQVPSMKHVIDRCQQDASDLAATKRHLVDTQTPVMALNDTIYWNYKAVDRSLQPWVTNFV